MLTREGNAWRRLAMVVAGALWISLISAAPPASAADTLTIDFESGPALGTAVNDDYLGSAFTRFLAPDIGFRPYRRSAPSQARSGTVVADVGRDVCFKDTGDAQGCEFVVPGVTGRLTRTASSITLYAGVFDGGAAVSAVLTAYRADGTVAGTSDAVPIGTSFTSPVSVASATADIARFHLTVEGPGEVNASLGFDDLTLEFPANSLPDISVSAPSRITTLRQGVGTDIPIDVTRLNGSNGPVTLSVSGLPSSVTASFTPNPLPTTQESATMTLTASGSAPEFLQPRELVVTADPSGNANVAPASRTATTLITLVTNFELSVAGGGTDAAVPACAASDVVVRVRRSLGFAQNGTVTLSVETGPAITGQILPSPDIPPGGNLSEERTLRLRWTGDPAPPQGVVVRAKSPGLPDRTLSLIARTAAPTAQVQDPAGLAPRRGQPGSRITLTGNGLCPGTTVQVGNELATAGTDVAGDGRSLTFRIPRLGTDGPVTVVPPTGQKYPTGNTLKVTTFRNREGFAFDNYKYGWLSYSELTDLVGAEDLFVKVNPCWPWATCTVVTGIPDPLAYLTWGILNIALHESGGHCFGISRTLQELLAGKVSYSRFAPGATWPYELPSASGPNAAMSTRLDSRHAGQGTSEFLTAWLVRDRSLTAQLNRVRRELEAGRYPGISLTDGFSGHVVTAYDVEEQPDGSVKVYVYDNNRPFTASELGDKGDVHRQAEVVGSVITINPDGKTWRFAIDADTTYTGGGADFYAVPLSAIPDDPSLPGIPILHSFAFFGSPGAAATVSQVPQGGEYLPMLDSNAVPGAAGTVVAPKGNGPVRIGVEGHRSGEYSQTVAGAGFAAGVREVRTSKGVQDELTTDPAAGQIAFAGGARRTLDLDLAVRRGAVRRSATVSTTTAAGGQEVAGFTKGRRLTYRHDGPATKMSFTLVDVGRRGARRFESGPLAVPKGATVTAKPSWRSLDTVRLTVRSRGGTKTRVLRNKVRNIAKIRLVKPRASKRGVSVRYRVKRAPRDATLGVVLRLKPGGVELTKGLAAPGRRGVIRWKKKLPVRARYTGTVKARLVVGGRRPATVTTSRTVRLRVR